MIKSWSYSRLTDFESCKRKAFLKIVQKIPEPERPLPPGKTEHANDRGTRVHNECENFVKGASSYLPFEAEKHFGTEIAMLRTLYEDGMVSLEGEWGMDENWVITEWAKAWHRSKLDAMVFWSDTHASVIDYKTGKKFGNEIKHGEQLQLYAVNAALRFPKLEVIETALWYLDLGEVTSRTLTRDQALRFKSNFDRRGRAMTTATAFPPNANRFSCKWCPYGPKGTGHCDVGVQD